MNSQGEASMTAKTTFLTIAFLTSNIAIAAQVPENSETTIIIGTNNITVEDSSIVKADTLFNYAPPQGKGDIANKSNVKNIERLLSQKVDLRLRSKADVASRANLFYKVGSYYLHDNHDPDAAIKNMLIADNYLRDPKVRLSNYNNLASAYTLKYEKSHQNDDKLKAIRYSEMVIQRNRNMTTPELAFAYCVKGRLSSIDQKSLEAQKYYNQALDIYKKTNNVASTKPQKNIDKTTFDTNQKYSLLYNYCQIEPTAAASYCQDQTI